MPSHKSLKSISHNFGHSFISLMNYVHNDYFLGHLLKQARITKLSRLEIDILKNTAEPSALLTKAIIDSMFYHNKSFPELVKSGGSTMDYIQAATITIEFDLHKSRYYSGNTSFIENPFTCETKIIDDRGKEYTSLHSGWWFPEN